MKKFSGLHSQWVENISKLMPVKFFPTKSSCVCSKHFSVDMFEKANYSKRVALKPYDLPAICNE